MDKASRACPSAAEGSERSESKDPVEAVEALGGVELEAL